MSHESVDRTTDSPERLLTGAAGRVSVSLSCGWFGLRLGREALPPLLPALIESLDITSFKAGLSLTLLWALYAMMQYPGGRISDQLSRSTVLSASLAIMSGGFLALTMIETYIGLLASIVLVGLGGGLYFTASRALLSDMYIDRRGLALGINDAAGTVGSAVAAGVVIVTLQFGRWQLTFIPVVGVLVLTSVLLYRWRQEPYVITQIDFGFREMVRRVVNLHEIRWVLVAYSLFTFATSGILSFLPVFLQVDKGFSPLLANGTFAVLFVVGMVASPAAGAFSDRMSRTLIAAGGITLAALGLAGMLVTASVVLVAASVLLYAVGIRVYPPVMQAYLFDYLSNDTLGGDFGALKGVYTGVGSLGPAFVGIVASETSYSVAFGPLILCFLASIGILLMLSHGE